MNTRDVIEVADKLSIVPERIRAITEELGDRFAELIAIEGDSSSSDALFMAFLDSLNAQAKPVEETIADLDALVKQAVA